MSRKPRISLVIPVYNEEALLRACLQAAVRQVEPFYEIIVVDNNSTDKTRAIVRNFEAVRLLSEPKQGVVHARDSGFNAAAGDIIARIDADTVLPTTWTRQLDRIFRDVTLDAVTGKMHYYDMALPRMVDAIDLFFRRYFARVLGRHIYLQGSNMAIRKSVWRRIRHVTCSTRGMHEDLDLAVHATGAGYQVRFDERLTVGIAYRQADSSFGAFCKYALSTPATYRRHGLKSCAFMYPVVALAILSALPLKILHRGYDPSRGQFSLESLLFTSRRWRVNPASFVD